MHCVSSLSDPGALWEASECCWWTDPQVTEARWVWSSVYWHWWVGHASMNALRYMWLHKATEGCAMHKLLHIYGICSLSCIQWNN